jgi:tetratricopeptide (TPR) repeat protein
MDYGEQAVRAEALELLEQRKYRDALDLLKQRLPQETDGEGHALLGLAHYHLEEYASAVEHYSAAQQHDAGNQDWQEILDTAKANTVAEIQVPVPDVYFFDRGKLLAEPIVPNGALPLRPPKVPGPGPLKRLKVILETLIGAILGFITDALIQLVGKVIGYRGKVWTNWYNRWYLI